MFTYSLMVVRLTYLGWGKEGVYHGEWTPGSISNTGILCWLQEWKSVTIHVFWFRPMCAGWHVQDIFNYFLVCFFYFLVSCRRGLLYMVRGFCSKVVPYIGCRLGCTLGTSLVVLVSLTVGANVLLGIVVLHLTSQANVAGICFS